MQTRAKLRIVLFAVCTALTGCATERNSAGVATSENVPGADYKLESDVARLTVHLQKFHPGETWKTGPDRLDSAELQRAYPGSRFYFVATPQPMPGGAVPPKSKEVKAESEKRGRAILSLCIRIGAEGELHELRIPADYEAGAIPVLLEEDARVVAAAILSTLDSVYAGPETVPAANVTVQKLPTGWSCLMKNNLREGRVVFDQNGRCVSARMRYAGPFRG